MGDTLKTQADIDKELEEWAKVNNYDLTAGPDQVEAAKTVQSYRDYLAARNAVDNAPAQLQVSKDAYLRQRYGGQFEEKRKELALEEVRPIAKKFTDEHVARVRKANTAYNMYDAVAKFTSQSVQDYLLSLELHTAKIKEASSSVEFQSTVQRKTHYLNEEISSVESWDTWVSLLVISVSLVYGYQFIILQREFRNLWIWAALILMWLASYLLPMIVNWLVHIPKPVNVYSSWAKTEQTEWHGNDDF